ncbi:hypothetical protein TRFO_01179 [Tritrichomonas foetus]|uniref:Uncharacterized protein n=1 Tax=Tritrichomonas foetus TaxID=1144522 RepID=A0A1J4KIM6_9EUKA|nr:hypothetical protein TRFO_01179 [Tritrichomonas foetus]|eukprot:OHT11225.1 hypothetical protein TRFO_01179 [Tritrichomonas foetus]
MIISVIWRKRILRSIKKASNMRDYSFLKNPKKVIDGQFNEFQRYYNETPQLPSGTDRTVRIMKTIFFTMSFLILCKLTHFRQKILHDVRINRNFLYAFYGLGEFFIVIYLYLLITLRLLRPANRRVPVDKWEKVKPFAMYAGSMCLIMATICFIFALWPAFHVMTFIIGTVGFVNLILVAQWIPI